MKRFLTLLSLVLFAMTVVAVGTGKMQSGAVYQAPPASQTAVSQLEAVQPQLLSSDYVSLSDQHKVMISAEDSALFDELMASGSVKQVLDYESFRVVTVGTDTVNSLKGRAEIRDDMNVISLNGFHLDTTNPEATLATLPPAFSRQADLTKGVQTGAEAGLYLVQFTGPIQDEWYTKLAKTGVHIVAYTGNNAYVVDASASQVQALEKWKANHSETVQYIGFYEPAFRVSPTLRDMYQRNASALTDVTIQVVDGPRATETLTALRQISTQVLRQENKVLEYRNITLTVPTDRIADISRMDSVFAVAYYTAPVLMDERQGQILAGNISGNAVGAPGYLAWLQARGFSGTGQFDFTVDVTDDGVDRGSNTDVNNEFKVNGQSAGASRLVFNNNYTGDSQADSGGGHGSINASIIFGYNNSTGSTVEDAGGHNYGLGICPWVKVGNTKVFSNGSGAQFTQEATIRLRAAYNGGARISNNSWGYRFANDYNADSQEHDVLVRDADNQATGNQELTIVFAAGNSGSSSFTVSPPGTAKNIICVAAFENDRQTGTDGCGTDNSGANNVNDVIGFSGRGPTSDGRVKPDLGGPGTHIQGAASRSTNYDGASVCNKYWPTGQTLYAWSSGTSHSAPAICGVAALIRQYFINQSWTIPSPAMVKAYMANATRYMTGTGANDTLPSNSQGMGSAHLATCFDGVSRVRVDQTEVFGATGQTRTVSGTVVDNSKPFRVTLVWTDAAGSTTGNAWVNNLDLEVTVGGQTYKGNVFSGRNSITGGTADTKNNMESVFLPAGVSGAFSVTVKATNIAGDGVRNNGDTTDQDYALVVYNGTTAAPTPDFTISTNPTSSGSVTQGGSATTTVTVAPTNGYTGTVNLSVSGLPANTTANFVPTSITTSGSSTLTINTTASTPTGIFTLTITGTDGVLTHTATYTLTVGSVPTGDFSLTTTPKSGTWRRNAAYRVTVKVTRTGGHNAAITLSQTANKTGLFTNVTFSPNPVTATKTSSSATFRTAANAPTGAAVITISGTDGVRTRTATVNIKVQ
ncbi:MAG: S8 family serine peptidase [Acidobacteria bacterium]|nr:S8 family serine peptidase [Acidobacteriota bacterium]